MMFDWSDDNLQRLRDLHQRGLSYRAIGAELGVSKNAVIGKVGRLGLPHREPAPRVTPVVVKPAPPKRLPPIVQRVEPKCEPLPKTDAFDPICRATVPLAQLATFGMCRWPFDTSPTRYCGAVTTSPEDPNCSYCAEHAARARSSDQGPRSAPQAQKDQALRQRLSSRHAVDYGVSA